MNNSKSVFILLAVVVMLVGGYAIYDKYFTAPTEVRAVFVATGADGLIKYTIQQLELDKKHNLKLIITDAEPGEVERQLLAGEVDVSSHDSVQLVKSFNAGSEIRVFAPQLTSLHSLVVKADSPFKSLDDLLGAKIALLPKFTAAYTSIDLELRILGVNIEEAFSLTFGGIPDTMAFLTKGQVDAAFLPEPLVSQLISTGGFVEILNLRELWEERFGLPYMFTGKAAHAEWVDSNPKAVKDYRNMILEASNYVKSNPDFVKQYVRDVMKVESEEGINLIAERLPKVFPGNWETQDIESALFVMQKAAEFGVIDAMPENPERFFVR